jgi:hypothetical protein
MKANLLTTEHVVNAKLAQLRSSARFCLHSDGSYELKSMSVGEPVILSFQAGDRFSPYSTRCLFYSRQAVEALSTHFHGADRWWVFKMLRKRDAVSYRSWWDLCDRHAGSSVQCASPLIVPLSLYDPWGLTEQDIMLDLFFLVDLLTPTAICENSFGERYEERGYSIAKTVWDFSFFSANNKWGTKP